MSHDEQVFDGLHVEFHRGVDGGQGHPLLFVHGAWGGSWIFKEYLSYLPAAGWNCFAMNLRGHYKSDSANLANVTQWDYARDVMRLAGRISIPPILVGFGTGAHLIQLALSKGFPTVGAIFISAKLPNRFALPVPPEVMQMPELLPPEPLPGAPDIPPSTLQWLNAEMYNAVEPRAALIALLKGETGTKSDFVRAPYLVVNGELDDSISLEESKELAGYYEGKGTLDIVRGVSHEGILVGFDWREGANAIHSWLTTNGFNNLYRSG